MMDYVSASPDISSDAVMAVLDPSFAAYADYVPLYDDLASSYAADVAAIISPLLPSAYPLVEGAMAGISSSHPVDLISGDTAFTDEIRRSIGQEVEAAYLSAVSGQAAALAGAFSAASGEFSLIRQAYLNLSSVGGAMAVPLALPVSYGDLASLLANTLFSRLAEAERTLKNRPVTDSSSPYGVFWGGAF